ncbi:hypothetical protein FJ651_14510 [Paucihalobacter ruber]|uniref:Uncharacterized protein n=1 Tax=Paucihalobacter ruber TaxID=2567861 RepID=A0A506PEL4_9FLAO|nr:hypothetical protein [Paucihalobacter ruber]TPV32019.1 hypothetical protein FJ651_14510 [Paucihalobacter ruber]
MNCSDNNSYKNKWNYLDDSFQTVLVMHDFEIAKSRLINNDLFKQLGSSHPLDSLKTTINNLSNISFEGEALLAITNQKQFHYLLVADTLELKLNFNSSEDFIKDSLLVYNQHNINHTLLQNANFYSVLDEGFYLQTNNIDLLKSVLNQSKPSEQFKNIYQLSDKSKTISILSNKDKLLSTFFSQEKNIGFGNYYVLDLTLEETQTSITGVTQSTDSTSILNVLQNAKPCNTQFESIAPSSADYAISLCLSDVANFKLQLNINKQDSLPAFLNLAVEAAMFTTNTEKVMALRFPDKTIVTNEILAETVYETYREVEIYNFASANIFEHIFNPFIDVATTNYVFELNNFFVFTENSDVAKDIISDFTLGRTIEQSKAYKDIEPKLSNQSSVSLFQNQNSLQQTFAEVFGTENQAKLNNYQLSAFQLIYEDNFAHINGVISQHSTRSQTAQLKELFNITLENDIIGNPQFFTNHLNNTKDILVQDSSNQIYLISKDGKIHWNKRLDGPIRGEISEIDTYKNGRMQMAFVTDKTLHVLDRNGKDVSGYPKTFNDNITQPLSVFDYDNNKNYRLLVTQKNNLLMFDKAGKSVGGFKPELLNDDITTPPKHFRIGNKDYIVFAQGNTLQILDRVGKTRIKVRDNINFSDNSIYLNDNAFVTITADAKLLKVNNKGISAFSNLKTSGNTHMTADQNTTVFFSENKLNLNNKELELDFGNYTAPELYKLNNQSYITITDLQSKKGFVFNKNGKVLDNFPIYASGPVQLTKANGRNLYALTKTDNRSLVLYQF